MFEFLSGLADEDVYPLPLNWGGFRVRSVALMVEHRIPNPRVGGSSPSWPVETC